jgi:hypothetical protein
VLSEQTHSAISLDRGFIRHGHVAVKEKASEKKQARARTAGFAVRVFSIAIIATVLHSIAVSRLRPVPSGTGLRRPFPSAFLIAVRLLRRREQFTE